MAAINCSSSALFVCWPPAPACWSCAPRRLPSRCRSSHPLQQPGLQLDTSPVLLVCDRQGLGQCLKVPLEEAVGSGGGLEPLAGLQQAQRDTSLALVRQAVVGGGKL